MKGEPQMTDQHPSTAVLIAPASVPTHDDLVARAAELRETLWADAPEADRARRLTERCVVTMSDAGLNHLMTAKRFGGFETDVRTVLDVVTELGRGCGSSAWVTGVYNSGNFMVGQFPDQTRSEVWAGRPGARVALVLAPPKASVTIVDGGIVMTGTWGYASGSLHSDWIGLVVPVPTGDRPVPHLVLVPMSALTIKDTWLVTGMRGTGSNTVVADQVFVPAHRMLPYLRLVDGERFTDHPDEILYRASVSGVLQVFLLGAMIGQAQAALSYVLEKAPSRAIASSTYTSQTESVAFQIDVADAATMIDTAQLHAIRVADTVDRSARLGEQLDIPARARLRMDAAHTVRTCREAIDLLMTAHGTSAFAESSPLQRIWRDVSMGSRHGGFGARIPQEVYGRAMLGLDPRKTSYLL
jgi:3-hydroxy-9,10-secoandrosta-1,3,5(10)-triene-9,17-dione monooxygenase